MLFFIIFYIIKHSKQINISELNPDFVLHITPDHLIYVNEDRINY